MIAGEVLLCKSRIRLDVSEMELNIGEECKGLKAWTIGPKMLIEDGSSLS